MKATLIFILLSISSINLLANTLNKSIEKNGVIYTIKKNGNNLSIIERIDKNGKSIFWEPRSSAINLHTIFVDDNNVYLVCFDIGTNSLYKIKQENNFSHRIEIYPPIKPSSSFYGFNFEMIDDKIMISIVGDKEWIKKETNYNNYFYEDKEKLWFPKDNNGNFIYKEARSAIRGWFYDGKLKRWYPAPSYYKGDFNKDLWIEKTPTQEMISFMHQLWNRSMNGEEVDYFAEFTKIFKREKKNDLLLESKNNDRTENSKK